MCCPRCNIEGELIGGVCPNCGYRGTNVSGNLRNTGVTSVRPASGGLRSQSGNLGNWGVTGISSTQSGNLRNLGVTGMPPTSGVLRAQSAPLRTLSAPLRSPSVPLRSVPNPSRPLSRYTGMPGDILNQGRYRLIEQFVLPDNQREQGVAWLAADLSAGGIQVVVREVVISPAEQAYRQQTMRAVALRLSEVSQHPGFPKVVDVFREGDRDFIVLQHIKGESLASLLKRQGGALPEFTVAEYGRQLCEMLTVLNRQQPPVVHGAISPETVIISPDRTHVHLIHLPFFPPNELSSADAVAGYKPPEQVHGIADPAADLYAVAATMHHAVTGSDPSERAAFFYPVARRLNPDVSSQMETILARELRHSVPQRYMRAADMQQALTALLSPTAFKGEEEPILFSNNSPQMDMLEIRERGRRRSLSQLSLFAGICLVVLLCVVFFVGVYPSLKSSNTPPNATATTTALSNALNHEWQAEAATYQKSHIALSDGRFVFDTYAGRSRDALVYKSQAAQAMLNNDLNTAFSDYQNAVTFDLKDAEARIYSEDLRIEMQNASYITIVLALPLNDDSENLLFTRPDLQAAFVFQDQVNSQNLLPNGLKLRILIGNSGGQDGDATTIAQYVANRVQIGNLDHIVAVVGWPTTGESRDASAILAAAKSPLISQTASGVSLDGLSPYFFRVNPDDNAQGQEQGKFAYQQLGARRVLV